MKLEVDVPFQNCPKCERFQIGQYLNPRFCEDGQRFVLYCENRHGCKNAVEIAREEDGT